MNNVQAGAEAGIQQAVEHAEAVTPGWFEQAYQHFRERARTHEFFKTEDARVAAYAAGLPRAPTDRAWGAVARRAVLAGDVVRDRYAMSKVAPANAGYRAVWRSLILLTPASLDQFHDHVYFTHEKSSGGWAVYHEMKPRRNEETGTTTHSLRIPVLIAWEGVNDPEALVERAAKLLNKHWAG